MACFFSTLRARAALWAFILALSVLIGQTAKAEDVKSHSGLVTALIGLANVVLGSALVVGATTAVVLAYGNADRGAVVVNHIVGKLREALGRHLFACQLRGECQLAVGEALKELTA